MSWIKRLFGSFGKTRLENQLDDELQFHIEMRTQEFITAGMTPEDARRHALRLFGNRVLLKERTRDMDTIGWIETLWQDLRYGARVLRKSPAFTTVALVTLAVGIGATTAVYTVVHAVLLAPLPYPEPDRLVMLFASKGRDGGMIMMSAPDAADLRAESTVFKDIAAAGWTVADLAGPSEPQRIAGSRVTANFFSVLGVRPVVGRWLATADDQPNAPTVVVLSHTLWQQQFGGEPAVIGKAITLGKQSRIVVGVMPPGFHFPSDKTEFWFPLASDPVRTMRGARMFRIVGRLKPGVTFEQASAQAKTIIARLERTYPDSNTGWSVRVVPLAEAIVGDVRSALLILSVAVGLVLLVACANVASLLLARGAQRQREISLRAALGAGRGHLVRLLFVESLLLAILGGALGAKFAAWGVDVLVPLYPPGLPRAAEIRINAPVLGFTMMLSVATGVLFGLLPAIRASRTDLNASLKSGLQSGGFRGSRARGALVIAQVALAMVLLTCAGLLVKSFLLRTLVNGFDPANVLVVNLPELPPERLAALLERIRALPGVTSSAASTSFPYAPMMSTEIEIGGRPKDTQPPEAIFDIVTPGYFRTLHIPLRKGRVIEERDSASAPAVVVINEAMALRYFPGEESLGKEIRKGSDEPWRTIVGVVGNVPPFGVERDPRPAMYLPFLQDANQPEMLAVRSALPPHDVAAAVRSAIRALEPHAPIIDMATMDEDLSRLVASPRFYMLLLGLFAAIALALAALGIYGAVSFAVSRRTHELGVRMALGASSRDVLKAVMREGAALGALGAGIGAVASLGATRLLSSLLFRVRPVDPLTFVCVPAVLFASALAACWVPARRATKIDPMEALRYE